MDGTTISLSSSYGTASPNSVDLGISCPLGWQTVAALSDFQEQNFTNATQLVVDCYVDAPLYTGCNGWASLNLAATGGGKYQANFCTANPTIVQGANSVTFTLSYATVPAASVTQLFLTLNDAATAAVAGNIYIGDIKIIYSPTCVFVPTPIAADSWTFENASLTNSLGTWIKNGADATGIGLALPGVDCSTYAMGVTGTWAAANDSVEATITFSTNINASTFNGVQGWVYAPAGSFPSGGGVFLQVADGGTNYPETGWNNIVPGQWTYINFPVSAWLAASPTFDLTNLHMVQFIVQDGAADTEYFLIDNVELY
jgi:hypothetical protein